MVGDFGTTSDFKTQKKVTDYGDFYRTWRLSESPATSDYQNFPGASDYQKFSHTQRL